jgi:hypothetical protein
MYEQRMRRERGTRGRTLTNTMRPVHRLAVGVPKGRKREGKSASTLRSREEEDEQLDSRIPPVRKRHRQYDSTRKEQETEEETHQGSTKIALLASTRFNATPPALSEIKNTVTSGSF